MDKNKTQIGDREKMRVISLSFTKILKDLIHQDGTKSVERFLDEALYKINFQIYLNRDIDFVKNSNNDKTTIYINNIEVTIKTEDMNLLGHQTAAMYARFMYIPLTNAFVIHSQEVEGTVRKAKTKEIKISHSKKRNFHTMSKVLKTTKTNQSLM